VEEPDAVRVRGRGAPGSLERAARLAHAAGAEDGYGAVLLNEPDERSDFNLAADECFDARRQSRRERRFETRSDVQGLDIGGGYRTDVAVTGAVNRLYIPWL